MKESHGPKEDSLFTKIFRQLIDPRRTTKGFFYYPFEELLFLCISSSLSGFDSWTNIELSGKDKINWLRKFYPYKNGTPSHDVLGKLFARLDTDHFNQCFIE